LKTSVRAHDPAHAPGLLTGNACAAAPAFYDDVVAYHSAFSDIVVRDAR
jgi:hypothetical protein